MFRTSAMTIPSSGSRPLERVDASLTTGKLTSSKQQKVQSTTTRHVDFKTESNVHRMVFTKRLLTGDSPEWC